MSDTPQNPVPANDGLSESAACGLAYVTIIPAIIFLVVAPYNQKPIIKFHAWQQIGLTILSFVLWIALMILAFVPFVNIIAGIFGMICWLGLFILWLIAMIQAFQGKRFNIPIIAGFAAKQAGL